jgi:hypothetical protein
MRLLLLVLLAVFARAQKADGSASISGVIQFALTEERAIEFTVEAQSESINLGNTAHGMTPGKYELKHLTDAPRGHRSVAPADNDLNEAVRLAN